MWECIASRISFLCIIGSITVLKPQTAHHANVTLEKIQHVIKIWP